MKKSHGINIDEELNRVESSISAIHTFGMGLNVFATAKEERSEQKQLTIHTPDTCRPIIQKIIKDSLNEYVVVIDNFERLQYFIQDFQNKYLYILSGFTQTFSNLPNDNVAFIITLDEYFAELINRENTTKTGSFSFAIGDTIPLYNFTPMEMYEVLNTRLNEQRWKKSFSDFIDKNAYWFLYLASSGHPRKFLKLLRVAMKYVCLAQAPLKITFEFIKRAALKENINIDEQDIKIIQYLETHGPQSPIEDSFQKAIGITQSPLRERLKKLTAIKLLEFKMPSKASDRGYYNLSELP